ncbi:MAG TPA: ABC transporter ATP-binding protein [Acetobacteraceae bacterium]|nr:ABC transporter ATP-binding protein [Acetobacteraceae bacterium]
MPDIRLLGLTRRFGSIVAVNDVTMTFPEGTVTCLLGPSGCGKTTLMRMIAGLEAPSRGTIAFGERDVTRLPARLRDVGMVFQYPVMYRTLTVQENIELALQHDRRFAHDDRRRRVEEVLDVLHLSDQRDRRMAALDSGTRQKVAVGRAIARSCDVILFDEPTTNVEVHAKLQLLRAFKEFRTRFRQTIIYVTHDQTEAMTLADQIALMRDGRISQCSPPRELYDYPDSEFGGWFLGNPGMNFIEPSGERDGGVVFDVFPHPLAAPAGGAARLRAGIRPEYVRLCPPGSAGAVPARLLRRAITIGGQYLLTLAVGQARLKAKVAPDQGAALPTDLAVECPLEHVMLFRDNARLAEAPRALAARASVF